MAETPEREEERVRREVAAEVFGGKMPENAIEPEKIETETTLEATDSDAVDDTITPDAEKDEWAGVPEIVRKQLEGITGALSSFGSVEERLKQAERRIGSIQNAKKNEKPAPTAEEVAALAETKKRFDDLQEEFPELAASLVDVKAEIKSAIPDISSINEKIEQLQAVLQGQSLTPEALELRLVDIAHPGWRKTRELPEMKTWLATQPEDIQQKYSYGRTAEEAIAVLNKFEEFRKQKSKTNNTRLKQAVVSGRGRTGPIIKSEEDMTEEELRRVVAAEVFGT